MALSVKRPRKAAAAAEEEESTDLPTELLAEILSSIPVVRLLDLVLVSKEWLQLICSPQFIRTHLSRNGARRSRILISRSAGIVDVSSGKKIPYPPGFSGEGVRMLGSCDGLICLFNKKGNNFSIFNPSTRKSRDISAFIFNLSAPPSSSSDHEYDFFEEDIYICWFGRHPCTGDHVFLLGTGNHWDDDMEICVYKLKAFNNNSSSSKLSWEQSVVSKFCDDVRCQIFDETGTLLYGRLHWPASRYYSGKRWHLVLAYDFQKNDIVEIPAPGESPFTLGVKDGCLFAMLRPGEMFELWVMKDYGAKEYCWMKYAVIEGCCNCKLLVPLGFSWDGHLLLYADTSELIKYKFGDKEVGSVTKVRGYFHSRRAIACTDSLVPPELVYD